MAWDYKEEMSSAECLCLRWREGKASIYVGKVPLLPFWD